MMNSHFSHWYCEFHRRETDAHALNDGIALFDGTVLTVK